MIKLLNPPSRVPTTMANVPWSLRLSDWSRQTLCQILNRIGAPGVVQPATIKDEISGHAVTIRNGVLFTVLTIDGRDFYFDRITGRFDGTGQCVAC